MTPDHIKAAVARLTSDGPPLEPQDASDIAILCRLASALVEPPIDAMAKAIWRSQSVIFRDYEDTDPTTKEDLQMFARHSLDALIAGVEG